jgi:hypothetical protein
MTNFTGDELHARPLTFMGAPFTHDLSGAKAAVLGVPFDCGIHPFRNAVSVMSHTPSSPAALANAKGSASLTSPSIRPGRQPGEGSELFLYLCGDVSAGAATFRTD